MEEKDHVLIRRQRFIVFLVPGFLPRLPPVQGMDVLKPVVQDPALVIADRERLPGQPLVEGRTVYAEAPVVIVRRFGHNPFHVLRGQFGTLM